MRTINFNDLMRDLDFKKWALGDEIKNPYLWQVPDLWNKLHGDKLLLDGDTNRLYSLKKMYEIYLEETGKPPVFIKEEFVIGYTSVFEKLQSFWAKIWPFSLKKR